MDDTLRQLLKLVTKQCKKQCKKKAGKKQKVVVRSTLPDDCETITAAIQALQELHVELGCPGV